MGPRYQFLDQSRYDRIYAQSLPSIIYPRLWLIDCVANHWWKDIFFTQLVYTYMSYKLYRKNAINTELLIKFLSNVLKT